MTEPIWMQGPPESILLATDLSARCDRALDRAVSLALAWGAKLHIVHAIEQDMLDREDAFTRRLRGADPAQAARARVETDLAGHIEGVAIELHVEAADPTALVLKVAAREGCGLIVTGVARDQSLGRYLLGSTVDHLVKHSPVPMLVVRDRVGADYRSVLVTTDLSPSSRHALEAATRMFPDAELSLFHAYDIPFAGYLENAAVQADFVRYGAEATEKFLAESNLPEGTAGSIRRIVERGDPETLLVDHARAGDFGLVVVGSHGGGALYDLFIGSTAAAIIRELPGDVLLVRDPRAAR